MTERFSIIRSIVDFFYPKTTFSSKNTPLIRQSADQCGSIFPKPCLPLPVIRQNPLHLFPKCSRMVHFFPMAQLMHNHIVHHFRWRQHQQTIKIQISYPAAAPPPGTLLTDGDFTVRNAYQGRKKCHPFRNDFPGPVCKRRKLPRRKVGQHPCFCFDRQVFFDPMGLTLNKRPNRILPHPSGATHQHLSRRCNLNRDCPSVASSHTILHILHPICLQKNGASMKLAP